MNLPGRHVRLVGTCGHEIFRCGCPASGEIPGQMVRRKCMACLHVQCARPTCLRAPALNSAYCSAECARQEAR